MSFITNIKSSIAGYKIKKLRKTERKKSYIDWEKTGRVLLLYSMSNKSEAEASNIYSELYDILDKFSEEKMNVRLIVCVGKSPLEQKRFNITVFDTKTCKLLTYEPPKDMFSVVEEEESDLLINLSPELSFPLEYLAEYSDAKLKVSVLKTGKGAKYDMYFSSESESVKEIFGSIKYYLQKIKAE
ncbi:MAG: hypothetical protein UIC45_00580 [Paludibacteraceae bacterium]|jgi:hypothetical protein|nr:hypothetical protein [Paludibacteraceae bacterium]